VKNHRTFLHSAAQFLSLFGAAGNAAAAAQFGRQPAHRTLETLGIDPEHYRQIRH
jgi:adenylosuccinate lyase